MTSQQKKQAINIVRQAARLRAMQWDLESDLEAIIGLRNGIGELIDTYATDIERPASEATHLEKLIPARELKYFTSLEAEVGGVSAKWECGNCGRTCYDINDLPNECECGNREGLPDA